jgi:hypothetical protein
MTELWSDNKEKPKGAGETDSYYKQAAADHGGFVSRLAMEDHNPYAYRPRYDSTYSESSRNNNPKSGFDGDVSIVYPQRSNDPPVPHSPASVLDPWDHDCIPAYRTVLHGLPPQQSEKSIARRSRAPAWEVVGTDQDEPEEYYIGDAGDAGPSAGTLNLSRSRSTKSNLHPILQNYSSPISACLSLSSLCCDTNRRV